MSEDRRDSGFDPTITPSAAIGTDETRAPRTRADTGGQSPATGTLPERYSLGKQLGAGGMGEVLLAEDKQIERDVAIKRMRMRPTPGAVARFVREAKIQGRLDHPAIVPVHEMGTDSEGRPYFVMKRLAGTTLAERIGGTKPLSRQKLLRAFADVCLAIEFAHSRRVIHRDLKPANIMLGDYGEVYVLDWGVARLLDEDDVADHEGDAPAPGATEVGAILGTPGYIAPELLRGERLDARADVYALGCILYELLAGEAMLPRGRAALVAALSDDVDPRPSRKNPDVPPELDALCIAATTRDRARRPSARELAERIDTYLDGDRDLALRKTLAATHAEAGRAARAAGDDETSRATAMREAGRALALDPRNADAADLIGRLMLEPPKQIPDEVHARVRKIEEDTSRAKVKLMEKVLLSFLAFVPALFIIGLRSTTTVVVLTAAILVNLGLTIVTSRRARAPGERDILIAWILFAALISVIARDFSPILLAPGIAAASVLMFALDPRAHWLSLTLGHIAAVLVPWLLEMGGVISATTTAIDGDLRLHSDVVSITMPEASVTLLIYAATLIAICGYIANQMARAHRQAVRTLELQAWQLRQLVGG